MNRVDPTGERWITDKEGPQLDRCDPQYAMLLVASGVDPKKVVILLRGGIDPYTLEEIDGGYSEERDCIEQAALEGGDPLVSLVRGIVEFIQGHREVRCAVSATGTVASAIVTAAAFYGVITWPALPTGYYVTGIFFGGTLSSCLGELPR